MSSSNEVFLGQKKAVARYNMDTKEAVWSRAVEDTPYIITTCGDNILVQSMNSWQTKNSHQLLNAHTGKEVWHTQDIKGWIVPAYHNGDIYFFNHKGHICKLCGNTGSLLFETKFKKRHDTTQYVLAVAQNKIYLISKKKTLEVSQTSGECTEISELVNFTQDKITAACGNGIDQMALFSVIDSASGGDGGAAMVVAGDGG
mgnify:FL=1|tara:strand:+ start:58 stop:660 length:603 start_codon:yes stop_codon:yes gene_type:complete